MSADRPTGRRRATAYLLLIAMAIAAFWTLWHILRERALADLERTPIEQLGKLEPDRLTQVIRDLKSRPGQKSRIELLQGIQALRAGDTDGSLRWFRLAASDVRMRAVALRYAGAALYRQGRHLEAVRVLESCLQIDPKQLDARRWLASSLYDIGAMELAMEHLAVIADQDPSDPRPNRLRGLIQKDFEQYSAAIDDYRESLRRDPRQQGHDQVRQELAEALIQVHRYEEALDTLELAADSADRSALLAQCHLALNRRDEAVDHTASALKLDPQHTKARLMHARLLEDEGDLEGACEVVEEVVRSDPGEFEPRYQLTNIYRRLGRAEDADRQMEQFQQLQQARKEFATLHEAAFADVGNADLRFQLGEIACQLYKFALAETWYEAALAINPQHASARQALYELREGTRRDVLADGTELEQD